ncbi:hypothetical protein E4U55_007323 [Claviceps digitariae]|nr:hypothetical protein E4U55_007323 [Claviceps digitariae]
MVGKFQGPLFDFSYDLVPSADTVLYFCYTQIQNVDTVPADDARTWDSYVFEFNASHYQLSFGNQAAPPFRTLYKHLDRREEDAHGRGELMSMGVFFLMSLDAILARERF